MAKTVPNPLTAPSLSTFQSGEPVTVAQWQTLNKALNYEYAFARGHMLPGMVFDTATAPWSTTSTGYTAANATATAQYDLDSWTGIFQFVRPMYSTADDQYSIRLDAYAENLDVRATLSRIDASQGTTNTKTDFTLTASTSSGDSEWVSAELVFTTAQQAVGGAGTTSALFLVYVEAKVPVSGTGKLWTFSLRETALVGGELPRS